MAQHGLLLSAVVSSRRAWFAVLAGFAMLAACGVTAAVAPISNCYGLDAENRLYDLTDIYGREFDIEVGKKTYNLRFCKDLQERSQEAGYVSFGTYESETRTLTSLPKQTTFIQYYTHGDLSGCENHGTEFNGRTAEVSVICGNSCPNAGPCKGSSGCICSVEVDEVRPCVASVVVAVPCSSPGPRVVNGFTVGFSPRGQEVVAGGLTQWGFENNQHMDYSFGTSQLQVFLYFSAPTQVAKQIGKPTYALSPSKGLDVQLSGTAASGVAPTTLTPSILEVTWRCEAVKTFLVDVTVPVNDHDPVTFSLVKICDFAQAKQATASNKWASFGVFSLILFLTTTTCCGAGFVYGTRVENKRGLDALPGISVLSSCLEAVSGDSGGYRRAENGAPPSGDNYFRDGFSAVSRGGQRNVDGRYGSVE